MEREENPGIKTLLHGFTNPENLHRVLHRRDTEGQNSRWTGAPCT